MRRLLLLFAAMLALTASAPAFAAEPVERWAFKAGGVNLFIIEIRTTGNRVQASWIRPEHWMIEGDEFSEVSGKLDRREAAEARLVDNGADRGVDMTFDDPAPHSAPDRMKLRIVDAGHASLDYFGLPVAFSLTRAGANEPVGPFRAGAVYVPHPDWTTNAEMTALFDADQDARKAEHIDWKKVGPEDTARRARTKILLDTGALQSGDDFYHAAFIFQHGHSPDDYLLAHTLAMIAVARGKPGAIWIASATLDRYLQHIKQPQIYGTQFLGDGKNGIKQGDYDRTLISDALRQALHVPSQAAQEERRRAIEKQVQAGN